MRTLPLALLALLIMSGGLGYAYRGDIRDAYETWNAPKLPAATHVVPPSSSTVTSVPEDSPIEGGTATSEHFVLESTPVKTAPKVADPFEAKGALPSEVNLDVPFLSQAPLGNWDMPYQEACEEASTLMVDAYYRNQSKIDPNKGKVLIDDFVAAENALLGYYKDTPVDDLIKVIKQHLGYTDVVVKALPNAQADRVQLVKRALANGYPIILPASGKELHNPNFRNGGPPFHMVVIKGYTDKLFITNDPGTRKGADYTYTYDTLMSAAHDWNDGDVLNGQALLMVIMPKK